MAAQGRITFYVYRPSGADALIQLFQVQNMLDLLFLLFEYPVNAAQYLLFPFPSLA